MERVIRIRGARQHNLKDVSVELPRNRLIVITGVSGSGKSSLAFDTLYAEGQRRYVESLSTYARQFLEQMEKPDVDSIEGLSPAIAIEQKGIGRNPRSTVGTVTEIHDHLRVLFARVGELLCHQCGRPVVSRSASQIADRILRLPERTRIQILAPIARGRKGTFRETLEELRRSGFVRARIDGEPRDLQEEIVLEQNRSHTIELVVDRLVVKEGIRKRLVDSLETALRQGDGACRVEVGGERELVFSQRFACPECEVSYPEVSPRLFSFNSPYGACPECAGLGERAELDADQVVPDPSLPLRKGAVAPWGRRPSGYALEVLGALSGELGFDLDTPFEELPERARQTILEGTGDSPLEIRHRRGSRVFTVRRPFEGVIPWLRKRLREEPPEVVQEELGRFLRSTRCAACGGSRLRPEARRVTVGGRTIVDVSRLSVGDAKAFFDRLELASTDREIGRGLVAEIRERLGFLLHVGLGYLTLDRAASTLSGGEGQRIRLATQIGSSLTGVLYILDEPSIGLHPKDNERLLETLGRLRDLGNTVLVVEHDPDTIRAADLVVELGPGAGTEGGHLVAVGTPSEIERSEGSITGRYLSGRTRIARQEKRRPGNGWRLRLGGAREHNLRNLDVEIPLGTLTCVTGVSGSGKSTLVQGTLQPALAAKLQGSREPVGAHDELEGWQVLDKVVGVDQQPIGRTPRSNPATYTGLFTPIRELFAQTPEARMRGYGPGRFSFNVKGGRCESCNGDGVRRIEMHFLPDVFVVCDECRGRRYNQDTLEVRYRGLDIAQALDLTIEDARRFFQAIPAVGRRLSTLADVGVGYLKLGQSATTLSGGEAQRLKLARELARSSAGKTLYVLDEPTTGLHMADIDTLLRVLTSLVDRGNTVLVIEHNLDVIQAADHVIDLGPGGGVAGGSLVASGTPEEVARIEASHTGRYLARRLGQ